MAAGAKRITPPMMGPMIWGSKFSVSFEDIRKAPQREYRLKGCEAQSGVEGGVGSRRWWRRKPGLELETSLQTQRMRVALKLTGQVPGCRYRQTYRSLHKVTE